MPRYVGVSSLGSGWLLMVRWSFSLILEREKEVATVFWQLIVTHQSGAHLEVLLSTSCILTVPVAVDSEACHNAQSLVWRALEMCWERLVALSLMKTTKRVGEITPPCGTPSLALMVWLKLLLRLTLVVLWYRKFLIQLNIRPEPLPLMALGGGLLSTPYWMPWTSQQRWQRFSSSPEIHFLYVLVLVHLFFLKGVCSLVIRLLVSRFHTILLSTMCSRVLLSKLMGLLLVFFLGSISFFRTGVMTAFFHAVW